MFYIIPDNVCSLYNFVLTMFSKGVNTHTQNSELGTLQYYCIQYSYKHVETIRNGTRFPSLTFYAERTDKAVITL